ncbi:MAG: hypothetical protein MR209_05665 [Veillonellaceae bacterium]|nr:hypothetical protein [Veillonellaceae bacterium]
MNWKPRRPVASAPGCPLIVIVCRALAGDSISSSVPAMSLARADFGANFTAVHAGARSLYAARKDRLRGFLSPFAGVIDYVA